MLSQEEIERRKPLWLALSELWKNTELFDYELNHIADQMISSGYSLAEIENICFREVAPAVYKNLIDFSGSWTGFEADSLYQAIVQNIKKQDDSSLHKFWVQSSIGQSLMTKSVKEDWQKITEIYRTKLNHAKQET